MSRPLRLSNWFEEDVARQTEGYLEWADAAVALAVGTKMDATLERIGRLPESGIEKKYPAPELAGLRFLPVDEPFRRFLAFYRVLADELSVERLIHGVRDLPRRSLDPPGAERCVRSSNRFDSPGPARLRRHAPFPPTLPASREPCRSLERRCRRDPWRGLRGGGGSGDEQCAGGAAGGDGVGGCYFDVSVTVPPLTVSVQASADGGATFAFNAVSLTGDVGGGVPAGGNKHVVWNAGADWDRQFSAQMKFNIIVTDSNAPTAMPLIPAGNFQMGNATNSAEGWSEELPVHTVYVSAFYMDRYEVTKQLWDDVRAWGLTHLYTDLPAGSGKASNHPVQAISWNDRTSFSVVECGNDHTLAGQLP